jgi:hypothetical protein
MPRKQRRNRRIHLQRNQTRFRAANTWHGPEEVIDLRPRRRRQLQESKAPVEDEDSDAPAEVVPIPEDEDEDILQDLANNRTDNRQFLQLYNNMARKHGNSSRINQKIKQVSSTIRTLHDMKENEIDHRKKVKFIDKFEHHITELVHLRGRLQSERVLRSPMRRMGDEAGLDMLEELIERDFAALRNCLMSRRSSSNKMTANQFTHGIQNILNPLMQGSDSKESEMKRPALIIRSTDGTKEDALQLIMELIGRAQVAISQANLARHTVPEGVDRVLSGLNQLRYNIISGDYNRLSDITIMGENYLRMIYDMIYGESSGGGFKNKRKKKNISRKATVRQLEKKTGDPIKARQIIFAANAAMKARDYFSAEHILGRKITAAEKKRGTITGKVAPSSQDLNNIIQYG